MQAKIISQPHGHTTLEMDTEASRAVFASIVFAARFHHGIAPLSELAEKNLSSDRECRDIGRAQCQ